MRVRVILLRYSCLAVVRPVHWLTYQMRDTTTRLTLLVTQVSCVGVVGMVMMGMLVILRHLVYSSTRLQVL